MKVNMSEWQKINQIFEEADKLRELELLYMERGNVSPDEARRWAIGRWNNHKTMNPNPMWRDEAMRQQILKQPKAIKNMIITKEKMAELENAAAPLVNWLQENCDPHCIATVNQVHVELLEGVCQLVFPLNAEHQRAHYDDCPALKGHPVCTCGGRSA